MNKNLTDFQEQYNNFSQNIEKQEQTRQLPIFKKRFREYNPDQITFQTFDPSKIFPAGCFERFIVETIKNIDISDFEKRATYDLGGPDEINPKAVLGIIFYGESDGVFSSRRLEVLTQFDQRYIFISGGETPDHSTIARFINKYEKEIANVFVTVLYIANNMGYLDYEKLATDGSKFKAYASEKFTGTLDDFKKKKAKLEKKIILAIEKQKETDKKEDKDYWKNKEDKHKKELQKIDNFLKDAEEVYRSNGKIEVKQNITDNDCRLMKMNNSGFSEAYNAQATACEKNGIITGCDITNTNDYNMLKKMVEKTINNSPEDKKEKIKDAKFLFDNGYYSIENLLYCDENEIDAYISDGRDKNIYIDKTEDHSDKKKLTSKDCKIEKNDDNLKISCPEGHELDFFSKRRDGDRYNNLYRIKDKRVCENCKNSSICLRDKNTQKVFVIRTNIIDNYDLIKNMYEKIRTEGGKKIYSRRMPTIEKIFGHIKKNLGFLRFSVIGLEKIRTHWTIICTVYNLKRMFNLESQAMKA